MQKTKFYKKALKRDKVEAGFLVVLQALNGYIVAQKRLDKYKIERRKRRYTNTLYKLSGLFGTVTSNTKDLEGFFFFVILI